MMAWESEVFSDAISKEIDIQYKKLLSVGATAEQAETLIVSHFINGTESNSPRQGKMWLALSLTEWKLGRLSTSTYRMAMNWLGNPDLSISEYAILSIKGIINSPMPIVKKIPLAKVTHCPWPEGSLLAYKISTNQQCSNSRYWNKYVLLQVVAIVKHPITYLAPSARYNESMVVALYKWVGDTIPNPNIVEDLEITPIRIQDALLNRNILQSAFTTTDNAANIPNVLVEKLTSASVDYYYLLDYKKSKSCAGEIVHLDCNTNFNTQLPSNNTTDLNNPVLSNLLAFDMRLVKRLEELFG